ncbi:uncharacterized protein DUF1080 [Spirosoma oryzae]|uniref:Uncharacterized protein DUF1080 n=1 Tax=Spirosoma oryzae TaxID=1469603 RepID=A0A2T0T5V5_9BACT|nr:DUF1080 domain-containing protein [Spirosoma oryzae]PRY41047.1 uncharacterized protein DUF1080 [Spirosoma oryzae]
MNKKTKLLIAELFCVVFLTAFLSPKDKWISLFDGKNVSGWHSYQKDKVVGWNIEDGSLVPDGTGGDLVTNKEYENFDLEFDFKIPKGSNSGVVYKVIENPDLRSTYMSGPEFQIIDDKGYLNEKGEIYPLKPTQLSGANYDMIPPANLNAVKPAGEWNKGRIVVNNNHVEHFLNGKKVADYQYGSDEWKAMVAKSKFKDWAYATPHAKGKIALQNHNPREKVWFRNIRIKEL